MNPISQETSKMKSIESS